MITLMVAFHLVFIGDTYPLAKKVVYSFHMPCFLFLSGFVCNPTKEWKGFLRNVIMLAVPYLIMEGAYIYGASIFPIREHIDNLNAGIFIKHLLVEPLGPYWYLHTLVLCLVATWCASAVLRMILRSVSPAGINKEEAEGQVAMVALRTVLAVIAVALLWLISFISLQSAIFFSLGIILKACKINFGTFFSHHYIVIAIAALFYYLIGGLDPFLKWNIVIVLLAITLCTSQCHFFQECRFNFVLTPMLFIGRNTLVILLFSPIFTILSKSFLNASLYEDPSGILFLCTAVPLCIGGSLLIGAIVRLLRLHKVLPFFAIKD